MLWTTQYQTCLHQSVSPLWRHARTHTHTPLDSPFFLKPCTKNRTPQTAITNVHPSRNTLAQKNTQCLCASPCSLLHTPASSATLRNMSKSSPRSACLFLCEHSRNIDQPCVHIHELCRGSARARWIPIPDRGGIPFDVVHPLLSGRRLMTRTFLQI